MRKVANGLRREEKIGVLGVFTAKYPLSFDGDAA